MKLSIKILLSLMLSTIILRADIHSDLQNLVTQGNTLQSQIIEFTLYQDNSCMEIGSLEKSIEEFTAEIQSITQDMVSFSITNADLDALDDLSHLSQNMSMELVRLSLDLNTISDTAELVEYNAALSAILQLSQDIGSMADRILEMADRILIMADNIGLMADRIVTTQIIQSQNIAVTQSSILITQQNMVALSDSISTITYNVTLGQIIDDANILAFAMQNINLDSTNLESQLSTIKSQTIALLNRTTSLLETFVLNSANMSNYINADTLTMLGDLSGIYTSLGVSLETYSQTIEQIAPLTDTVILSDATNTMLQLVKDIGIMSDRIMEMTDKIFIMADNIGVMSDRIVETQNIQMTNVQLTETSLLSSQSIIITVIKNFGL